MLIVLMSATSLKHPMKKMATTGDNVWVEPQPLHPALQTHRDEVAMRLPLLVITATFFSQVFEEKALDLAIHKPLCQFWYVRYMFMM